MSPTCFWIRVSTTSEPVSSNILMSNRRRRLRRFLRDHATVFGLSLFGALVILTGLARVIAPYPYDRLAGPPLSPRGGAFLLGTVEIGRDLLSRILFAGRVSLGGGGGATSLAAAVGLPLGLLSGYF